MKYINKPFDKLPLKKRAVYILYLAGYNYKQIKKITRSGTSFISISISMGKEEYPQK